MNVIVTSHGRRGGVVAGDGAGQALVGEVERDLVRRFESLRGWLRHAEGAAVPRRQERLSGCFDTAEVHLTIRARVETDEGGRLRTRPRRFAHRR